MTRLPARAALALVLDDPAEFTELPSPTGPAAAGKADGPLGWEGYDASRERARERTGESESVVVGTGRVGGLPAVLLAFEFGFLGGSLSAAAGDLIEAGYAHAREHRLPLVSLIATGGSRMQEGMIALTQLQRVARQSALTRAAGLPQLAVVRDPTTGGGWATLGAGADVVLALPGAQVGFAGSRVRPADADPYAYTAEGQWEAGHVDVVLPADRLPETLAAWVRVLSPRPGTGPDSVPEPEPPLTPPAGRAVPADPDASGWGVVLRTRRPERARAEAWLAANLTDRVELNGDRTGGRDPGVACGFGLREGRPVAYAAQLGTATRPAGFRTVTRLIRLADRLGVPVLTLVDTPGAANDAAAERAGAGPAIAETFGAVASARVPVTTVVVGEGGSGGALALAAPGRTWMAADSYFSVIAPELAAAILKREPSDVPCTADQLGLRPCDLVDLGLARGVLGG
ncbi:carboxyl transferase domain-containing protein [Streptomyces sp. BI20]|uniref:carboxyl transferase domain-containing protein n=1 Tax=Streptomyces sp. BI20 TaxID=3403460 RepID=UPI003C762D94